MSRSDDDLATNAGGPAARGADTMIDQFGDVSLEGPSWTAELSTPSYGLRYIERGELGSGGMGEVKLCFDRQMGREVALKVMLEEHLQYQSVRDRFEREGRVQAQLEHPGIVPVYDLGITPGGQPYLAMKRVRGITLQNVIRGIREGDEELASRYPRGKLLSVIERVCETMAYAHARGVTHRDLKPANVMLGHFGEVSVLDWGLAKLDSDSDLSDTGVDREQTRAGAVIGTAGYMAPEQASGDFVDICADVYALGAILFEVVTYERLHPQKSGAARIGSTISGTDARPSSRVGGVPPELDAICVKATATLREHRYPSAKELLEDLRTYLQGQRLSDLKREMAGQHVAAARSSLVAGEIPRSETVRVRALRDLGAAIVLDPGNTEMVKMIENLLGREGEVPESVERELEAARNKEATSAAGRSAIAYASGVVFLPALLFMGVRSWPLFGALSFGIVVATVGALLMWKTGRATGTSAWAAVPYAFGLVSLLSTLFGPFFLMPAVVVTTSVAFTISVRAPASLRRLITASGIIAVLLPALLQWAGVLPHSYAFSGGRVEVMSQLAFLPEVPTTVLMVVASVFVIVVSNALVGRAVESLRVAERKLFVQAHRLRSILPHS